MIKVKIRILRKDTSSDQKVYEDNHNCPCAKAVKRVLKKIYRDRTSFAWRTVKIQSKSYSFSSNYVTFELDKDFMYADYISLHKSDKDYVHRTLTIDPKYLVKSAILRSAK